MGEQYKSAKPNDEQWTPDKQRCYGLLLEFVGGEHHLGKLSHFGTGLRMTTLADMATFDGDSLTRLAILSHKHLCRVSIDSAGPRYLAIQVWARNLTGSLMTRHPSLCDLIERCQSHQTDIDNTKGTEQ